MPRRSKTFVKKKHKITQALDTKRGSGTVIIFQGKEKEPLD
ncbi:hypothetical protein CLV31_10321 [Algoriphagus aquaeductus]|uniref:Uncharacterized protein n=1 Tax=Algoriphagus aquaeductus TaxID=475299 RepID=A0A326S1T8_9BACT|nr:hypothetical protein CLV31_10321 [Algoriphagus aquaeductus]